MEKLLSLLQTLQSLIADAGRFRALFDKSAWLMMAPAAIGLYYTDAELTQTLLQWSLFALVIAGAAVVVSRLVFPQIDLAELMVQAKEGQQGNGAAIIVSSVVLFVAAMFIGIVIWAKT